MPCYSVGEAACRLHISVRTLQFYDRKNLMHPSGISQGGRRIYNDEDIDKLRSVLFLRNIGLSVDSIKEIRSQGNSYSIIVSLLKEYDRQIEHEIGARKKQQETLKTLIADIELHKAIPASLPQGMENIMTDRKKLWALRLSALAFGLILDGFEIWSLIIWIMRGIRYPFIICLGTAVIFGLAVSVIYYAKVAYICPECGKTFKPSFLKTVFARHNGRTRKLACPRCGYSGYCIETYDRRHSAAGKKPD